jgi:hypothetical protein
MDIKTTLLTSKVAAFTWAATTWNKIKDYVMGILAIATLLLFGYEKYQAGKVAKLQSQLNLLTTQKDADDLQIKINAEIADSTANGASADNLVALAAALETKRASLIPATGQTDQALSDSLGQELK